MPDVIIPEGYGQAVLIWSMLGKQNPMTSTIGYGAGLVPPQDAADAMYDCAVAAGSIADPNFMLSGFTFEGVRVYQETSGGLIVAEHLEPVSGVAIGTTPPVNASLLASKRTLYAGRKFRGRMYVPNAIIPEGDIDAMGILAERLAPEGRHILTIPVGQDMICAPQHRIYGDSRLPRLLEHHTVLEEQYWHKDSGAWRPTDRATALAVRGSRSFYALGLFVLGPH